MSQPARLVSTPDAPIPQGGAAEWVAALGGVRLRAALFPANGAPRGSVVLSPGRTEAIEKYFEVVGELQARGFTVLVHDWAGQGLSTRLLADPLLGHARGWRRFMGEFQAVLSAFEARLPRPWVALGHSMGGGLTTLALVEGESRFAAAVLSAPMLGVKLGGRSPAMMAAVAAAMGFVGRGGMLPLPQTDPLNEVFAHNVLTHDAARFARSAAIIAAAPELRLGGPTWGWIGFALALAAQVARPGAMERIAIPLTAVIAGDERLVENAAVRRAVGRAPKGQVIEVEGAYHEVLMETDDRRATFWRAFDETVSGL